MVKGQDGRNPSGRMPYSVLSIPTRHPKRQMSPDFFVPSQRMISTFLTGELEGGPIFHEQWWTHHLQQGKQALDGPFRR